MEVTVAKTAGFCFGVRNALKITEEEFTRDSRTAIMANCGRFCPIR